jgi:hypothetical protein
VGVAIHHDPKRLAGRLGVADRQLRVVGLLDAGAHHHRAAFSRVTDELMGHGGGRNRICCARAGIRGRSTAERASDLGWS